jgi:hypothetical protein
MSLAVKDKNKFYLSWAQQGALGGSGGPGLLEGLFI